VAKTSTLIDDFSTKDLTKWTWGTQVTQSTGKARFAPSNYVNCILTSAVKYDLTSSSIVFNFNAVQSTALGNGPFFDILLSDGATTDPDTGNRLVWHYEPTGAGTGTLVPRTITSAGVASDGTGVTYSATNTDFLRISDNGTNVIWETSPDGTTWTSRRSIARPAGFTLTSMYVMMRGTNDVSNTGTFDIDAVNPSTGPQTQSATASLPITAALTTTSNAFNPNINTLGDTFTTKDTAKWSWYGGAVAASGQLEVPANGWGPTDNGIVSIFDYRFVTGQAGVIFDVSNVATPTVGAEAILEMGVSSTPPDGTENRLFFSIYQTTTAGDTVEIKYRVGGVDTTAAATLTRQRYLRMRYVAPDMVMDTSADGTNWSTPVTVPTVSLFTLAALRVWVLSKGFGTVPYRLAAINEAAVAAPTPPTVPQTFSATNGVAQSVLTWTAPATSVPAITGYELTQSPGTTAITPLGATDTTTTVTGLTPGTTYTFSLRARNSTLSTGLGPAAVTTATPTAPVPTAVPGPPTGATATAGNATAAVLWTAPTTTNGTITGYDILDQNSVVRGTVVGTGTSTTISALTNGMQYTFRVVAKNASTSSALYLRSTLGFAAVDFNTVEAEIGQAGQPVVSYIRPSDSNASITGKVTAASSRGRRALLMLDISGWNADQLRTGGFDARLTAIGTALNGTGLPFFLAPLYEGNDWRYPWSPQYGTTSPGYDPTLLAGVDSPAEYKLVFDKIVRMMRAAAPLGRFVWVASVEDQPTTQGDDWAAFYPGAVADVICLKGLNYGNGPAQGGGATVWQTAAQIFDTAYATAETLHASKPIWLFTGSHDPSLVYAPSGSGFPSGATVAVDSTHSKGVWLTDLLNSTSYPRVTALVLYSISDTRNWSLLSSTTSSNAVKATVNSAWQQTTVVQDQMADYIRDSTAKFAAWLRSGTTPANRLNEYARPDAAVAGGTRGSLVFGVPYSPGQKTLVDIPVADELAWNRNHGLLLRQLARNGMQGWAYASGAMVDTDPVLLYDGTVTTTNRTTLATGRDTEPGPKMQVEGGLKDFEGGTAPVGPPAPAFTIQTVVNGAYTDPTTMISVDWTALTATQLTGYTLSGYRFGWATTDPRSTQATWDSAVYPVTTAPDPFVFTNLVPGAAYDVYVEAVMANGQSGKSSKRKSTDPAVANQTPSAPTSVAAANLTDTTMDITWQPPTTVGSGITGYYVSWGGWTSPVMPSTARSYSAATGGPLTGFVANTTYTIDVWAENASGMGTHFPLTVKTPAATTGGTTNPALQGMPTTTRLAGAFVFFDAYGTTVNMNTFNSNWNFLVIFNAESNGDGSFRWRTTYPNGNSRMPTAGSIAAARSAGKRVLLSVGGAGNVYNFLTRAASQRCVNSIIAINTQFGGTLAAPAIDGVDFNTFEAQALANSPAVQTAEYIWMGLELKRQFGSNFIVHGPPAPWNNDDMNMCRQALAAGAFDFVSPQYYDGGLATYNTINGVGGSSIDGWISSVAGGNAAKIGVGYGEWWSGAPAGDYMVASEIDRSWVNLKSRFPAMKAAWIWRSDFDPNFNSNAFGNTTGPKIRAL
jgi:hypothetical protein